jgi:hypothetical protein
MITRNWVFFGGSHVCFACALGFSSSLFRLLLSFLSGATCFFISVPSVLSLCGNLARSLISPPAHPPSSRHEIPAFQPLFARACTFISLLFSSQLCAVCCFSCIREKESNTNPLVFIPSRKLSFFYLRIRKARYDFENTDCSAQQMCTNVDAQKNRPKRKTHCRNMPEQEGHTT